MEGAYWSRFSRCVSRASVVIEFPREDREFGVVRGRGVDREQDRGDSERDLGREPAPASQQLVEVISGERVPSDLIAQLRIGRRRSDLAEHVRSGLH